MDAPPEGEAEEGLAAATFGPFGFITSRLLDACREERRMAEWQPAGNQTIKTQNTATTLYLREVLPVERQPTRTVVVPSQAWQIQHR